MTQPTPLAAAFASSALRLCNLLENADLSTKPAFDEIHLLLSQLYALGLQLPLDAELTQEIDPPSNRDRVAHVFTRVTQALGSKNTYLEVYDPYKEEQPLWASLADDISDIFGDLTEGLSHWDAGRYPDAVWEWRFGLEQHWGNHYTDALRALHWLRFDYGTDRWSAIDD
jgi:uncharacterized protein DUF5063